MDRARQSYGVKSSRAPLLVVPERACATCGAPYRDPDGTHARCARCVRTAQLLTLVYSGGRRPKASSLAVD